MRFCSLAPFAVPSGAPCTAGSQGEGSLPALKPACGSVEGVLGSAMPPKGERCSSVAGDGSAACSGLGAQIAQSRGIPTFSLIRQRIAGPSSLALRTSSWRLDWLQVGIRETLEFERLDTASPAGIDSLQPRRAPSNSQRRERNTKRFFVVCGSSE
jgi:hypothetical protein